MLLKDLKELYSDVIFPRKKFDRLKYKLGLDWIYINSRTVKINGKEYTIEVFQTVQDGNSPDPMNTYIFVIEEDKQ